MEFVISFIKKDQFANTLQGICNELRINMGNVQYHYEGNKVVVQVQDNVIARMNETHIEQLRSIK